MLPQSLGERQNFSVCSSWPGSSHSLFCLCSGFLRPGPRLQRLRQPSQTACHVNTQYGSEKAALSLCIRLILSENPQDSSPPNTFHCSWESVWSQPPGSIIHVRLELTHRQLQSSSPQGNKSSHLPKSGNTLGSRATGWLVGL